MLPAKNVGLQRLGSSSLGLPGSSLKSARSSLPFFFWPDHVAGGTRDQPTFPAVETRSHWTSRKPVSQDLPTVNSSPARSAKPPSPIVHRGFHDLDLQLGTPMGSGFYLCPAEDIRESSAETLSMCVLWSEQRQTGLNCRPSCHFLMSSHRFQKLCPFFFFSGVSPVGYNLGCRVTQKLATKCTYTGR